MNKFVAVFFAAALALALNACGDNGKAAADAKAASDKAAAAAKEASDKAAAAAKDAGTAAANAGAAANDAAKAAGGTAAMDSSKAPASTMAPAATPPASTMAPAPDQSKSDSHQEIIQVRSKEKAGLRRLFFALHAIALQRGGRVRAARRSDALLRDTFRSRRQDRAGSGPCPVFPGSSDPRAGSRRA